MYANRRVLVCLLAVLALAATALSQSPASKNPILSVGFAVLSVASPQTYTSIDYPGAIATEIGGGPNPEGAAIGSWMDPSRVWHGFVWKKGVFTSFEFPGAVTMLNGMWITP